MYQLKLFLHPYLGKSITFFAGPTLPQNCVDGSMVSSSNGREVILVGCQQNPEKIFRTKWTNGTTLEWVLMKQELKYPRSNAVAMLIPDTLLTHCNDSEIRGKKLTNKSKGRFM